MDNQRLLTWGLFIMMAWFTYQTWQLDYNTPEPVAVEAADGLADALPSQELPDVSSDLPEVDGDTSEVAAPVEVATAADVVRVTTDVLEIEFSTAGGTMTRAVMLDYPISKENPDNLITLLDPGLENFGEIRIGLRGGNSPSHTAIMSTDALSYTLDGDRLSVPFRWTGPDGVTVTREYIFSRGSYQVDVIQTIDNRGTSTWRGDQYVQLLRRFDEPDRSMFDPDTFSFDGPIVYDGESSEKLDFGDLSKKGAHEYRTSDGWVASIQHHFLNAIVPAADAEHVYRVEVANNIMTASAVGAKLTVEPGETASFTAGLFTGPKLQSQLEQFERRLNLTVDYGILHMLSQPMFWMLSFAHDYVANWGLAIILVTILIKLVFYKLTESSGRSMAKMRNLQPRMKALQDRYKDDRQALSQAMMDLYKREQVNPAAGCLPILVQMPFFLAFYWVLVESVEMRQAPFVLWLTDLSVRDPYFILPLIMGAAMFIQQKLNPAPADPVQARVMQIMPIMFTAMFALFPAGLVLYWATNTILSIAQQWKINKVVEREAKEAKARSGNKKSKAKDKSTEAETDTDS
ncbi:MAG: membrane protein insertase YidC [Pseudomonadota bacterium]